MKDKRILKPFWKKYGLSMMLVLLIGVVVEVLYYGLQKHIICGSFPNRSLNVGFIMK
ncbi:MAG: hypothetical protein QME14_02090 [Methanobacteriaceae archaeon]|nr:hypothetical protein [Methanobacteriaceae archaeon]